MNIHRLLCTMNYATPRAELPEYARTLVAEVEQGTGHPLRISEQAGLGYDSRLAMATPTRQYHDLAYTPQYAAHRVHFVVNAAVKIRRAWAVPPEHRLIPVTTATGRLPRKDEAELQRKLPELPPEPLAPLSRFLYHGLVRQLTSMPLDIRTEHAIAQELPEHRAAQHAYLHQQVRDLEPTFRPAIARAAPSRVHAASTAMNITLCQEAASIANAQPGPFYRNAQHHGLGERLRRALHHVHDNGYRGDREATDAWAAELGVRDWYEWRRLDEVR